MLSVMIKDSYGKKGKIKRSSEGIFYSLHVTECNISFEHLGDESYFGVITI